MLAHGTRMGNEGNQDEIEMMYAAMQVHDDSHALWEQGTNLYRAVLAEAAAHLAAQAVTMLGGQPRPA